MRKKTDLKRDTIVEVAHTVFLEAGYERASMAQIAERMCGSKATIYGYFQSKEALFVEAMLLTARNNFPRAIEALDANQHDLRSALVHFGKVFVAVVCSPEFIAGKRVILAESGKSEVGRLFHESGPRIGEILVAEFLRRMMQQGQMRVCDPHVATVQLFALLEAESWPRFIFGIDTKITDEEIEQNVDRAVDTFVRAYAPEAPAAARKTPARKAPAKRASDKRAAKMTKIKP